MNIYVSKIRYWWDPLGLLFDHNDFSSWPGALHSTDGSINGSAWALVSAKNTGWVGDGNGDTTLNAWSVGAATNELFRGVNTGQVTVASTGYCYAHSRFGRSGGSGNMNGRAWSLFSAEVGLASWDSGPQPATGAGGDEDDEYGHEDVVTPGPVVPAPANSVASAFDQIASATAVLGVAYTGVGRGGSTGEMVGSAKGFTDAFVSLSRHGDGLMNATAKAIFNARTLMDRGDTTFMGQSTGDGDMVAGASSFFHAENDMNRGHGDGDMVAAAATYGVALNALRRADGDGGQSAQLPPPCGRWWRRAI